MKHRLSLCFSPHLLFPLLTRAPGFSPETHPPIFYPFVRIEPQKVLPPLAENVYYKTPINNLFSKEDDPRLGRTAPPHSAYGLPLIEGKTHEAVRASERTSPAVGHRIHSSPVRARWLGSADTSLTRRQQGARPLRRSPSRLLFNGIERPNTQANVASSRRAPFSPV